MNENVNNSAKIQRILEERAHLLAAVPENEAKDETSTILVLALEKERLGIPIDQVSEIQPFSLVSFVPGIASWWIGLINLRSNLVPLLDLRVYLGLPAFPISGTEIKNKTGSAKRNPKMQGFCDSENDGEIVIINNDLYILGILVDRVLEIRKIFKKEINPPLKNSDLAHKKVVEGVTPDLITILSLDRLMTDSRLVIRGARK